MRRVQQGLRLHRASLWHARRTYQVIQRGHDRPQESLYDKLGFAKDDEARRVRRTVPELQQGLLRQVEELKDPINNPKDKQRLAELKKAYTLLHDDNFRANYGAHFHASNDARLHVLCDGGQVAANFNPEHRHFTYVDHAIDRDGRVKDNGALAEGGAGGASDFTAASAAADARTSAEAPSAEALRDAFRNATGVGSGSSGATSSSARAFNAAEAAGPLHGTDISHLLRISLEQSFVGCAVAVDLHRNVSCTTCRGSGRQRLSKPRRCPQCLGRGATNVPSATYHIERRCLYCGGEGTMPPPPCRSCEGRGVQLHVPARVVVHVPPGTLTNSLFRLRHHGNDGARGGMTGDVLVTVLVSEHRYFYHHKERPGELHAMLPLPLSVALLGGRVEVPTLQGRGMLHVPPCVRNGQVLSYDVYGVGATAEKMDAETRSASQLFFHALVMIPRVGDLSGRQREALGLYEEGGRDAAAGDVSATPPVNVDVVDEAVEGVEDGPSSADAQPSRADRMAECAAMKSVYRHWFTSM